MLTFVLVAFLAWRPLGFDLFKWCAYFLPTLQEVMYPKTHLLMYVFV